MTYESFSENDTAELARELARGAQAGEILCLEGDLGAGKTAFAKGFAQGLGVETPVTSPTFTILKEYRTGRLPLYHFDVYRIEEPEEMYELGYEEYFFGDGVCLVEWPQNIVELIPGSARRVRFSRDPSRGDDYRRIELPDRIPQ